MSETIMNKQKGRICSVCEAAYAEQDSDVCERCGCARLKEKILRTNLKATERYLHELGQGSFAYYVRQALDKLYPNWRLEK